MGAKVAKLHTMKDKKVINNNQWPDIFHDKSCYICVLYNSEEEALKRAMLLFIKTYNHTRHTISYLTFETKEEVKKKCAVRTIEKWWTVSCFFDNN